MALGTHNDKPIAMIAFTNDRPDPGQVRAHLHALIDQLTEDALIALWHVVCLWVTPHRRRRLLDDDH